MTKPQITQLLTDLKAEADKKNLEIDESFVEQLLVLKREGRERKVDPETLDKALNKLAREAITQAAKSGDARIRAGDLMASYALNDDPWLSDNPWE